MSEGISYFEVMGILGSLAAKDPTETGNVMKTYQLWNAHTQDMAGIEAQYNAAIKQVANPGLMDVGGVLIQLMKQHPLVHDLAVQTATLWKDDIPGLIKMLDDLQSAANNA